LPYFLDTSILLRFTNADDAQHAIAANALRVLHARGETIHITSQVLVELRNVLTRPTNVNGLALTPAVADQRLDYFERLFPLLPETPAIHPAWRSLVASAAVIGKQVHDARLAAVCQVHAVTHLLTFNTRHFTRFTPFIPTLTVIDPATV
jgi:predicted nucleic acid-binding protein